MAGGGNIIGQQEYSFVFVSGSNSLPMSMAPLEVRLGYA